MLNKKVKKIIALLAVTAMTGSLVAGCGSKPADSEDKAETSDVGDKAEAEEETDEEEGYSGKFVVAIHDQLNNPTIVEGIEYLKTTDKWKNVEFDVRPQDADYETNMPIEVMGGSQVDVVYTFNPIYTDSWAKAGTILPIDEQLKALGVDLDERYGSYAAGARVDGTCYGVPAGATSWGLFYNKSLFDDAGIAYPDQNEAMTWSEYRQLAADLTSGSGGDKVYGTLSLDWPMYWYGQAILTLGGGEAFYNEEGTSNIEDQAFADSIQLAYDMQNVDKSTPTYAEITTSQIEPDGWFAGNYAMYLHGTWFLNWLADKETYPRDYEVGFAPMPVPDGSPEGTRMNWGVVGTYSVAATTVDPLMSADFCVDLVEYATKYSSAEIYVDQSVEREKLFVTVCDEIDDEMFTTENVQNLFLHPDQVLVSEKVTGPNCSAYEAVAKEEVEMFLADAQDLETTIAHIKERADETIAK